MHTENNNFPTQPHARATMAKLHGSLNDPHLAKVLAAAQRAPEHWTVYLVPAKGAKATPAQHRLYRRLVQKMAQQLGKSVEHWHKYLVERYLGFDEVETPDGDYRRVLPSTASLTVEEFSSFLHACLHLSDEIGMV